MLSVGLKYIMKGRNTNGNCAYGQVASEGRIHLVGAANFYPAVGAITRWSRELFDAQTLEGLETAGVVSHCVGGGGGLGWG